jgi:hypothetical protein
MVKPPANTGNEKTKRYAVTIKDHKYKHRILKFWPPLKFKIVLINFIAPKIELAPARCNEKIAISTLGPL